MLYFCPSYFSIPALLLVNEERKCTLLFLHRDGWTPQHFKSSRSKGGSNVEGEAKPERRQQTANNFMDDEDRGHFGIAPQKIQTVDKFR